MSKLKVGYAGVAFSTYYAEENDQYNRAIRGLEVLASELDFELVAIPYGLTDDELSSESRAFVNPETSTAPSRIAKRLWRNLCCSKS